MSIESVIPARLDPTLRAAAERRSLMRAVTCMAFASSAKGQQPQRAASVLKTNWGEDSRAAHVLKAASSPTTTAAGFPAIPSYEVLPLLSPSACSMRLLRKARQLSLEGIDHVMLAGIQFAGRPPAPIFIAEGQPAPVVMATTSEVKLGPTRKILIQSSLTSELEATSGNTAQEIISDALSLATEQSMDAALFSTSADNGTTPGGLLNGVTPIAAGTATGAEGIATDVGAIADQISQAGINPDEMTLITSPKLATKIKTLVGPKFNFEIMSSKAIPSNNIVGIVTDALMYGYDGEVKIDVSREVAVHFEGASPQPISSASPVYSAYQMDLIVVRVRAKACWVIQPGACAFVQNVTW
jgi:hypothetical protein